LTTCGIAFAISKYFLAETKHPAKVQNKFAKLTVVEARIQDPSADKFLIPIKYPNLNSTTDTHKVIKTFVGKLDNQGTKIKQDMFLKTTIKYENDENNKISGLFNSQLLVDDVIYKDADRQKIDENKDYKITVETQQRDFASENLNEITVIVEYELVDSQGKSFEGTKEIIKSQIAK